MEERPLRIEDLVYNNSVSPGLGAPYGYELPLYREKASGFKDMETVVTVIVSGCIFGKMNLQTSTEPRRWMYNAISLTDAFIVSLSKNDILKMLELQRKRILNDQMNFLK